jgi:hypothetical protein
VVTMKVQCFLQHHLASGLLLSRGREESTGISKPSTVETNVAQSVGSKTSLADVTQSDGSKALLADEGIIVRCGPDGELGLMKGASTGLGVVGLLLQSGHLNVKKGFRDSGRCVATEWGWAEWAAGPESCKMQGGKPDSS